MNISSAWEAAAGRGKASAPDPAALWAALRARIATYLESRRRSRAAPWATPLDPRILRDVGMTPLGVPEAALAARNERR